MRVVTSISVALSLVATVSALKIKFPKRPSLEVGPKKPFKPLPVSPKRTHCRVCIVDHETPDAGPALIKAAQDCNNGGTVVLLPNTTYWINTPTDLTFLKHIDIAILGTIKFREDVQYWQNASYGFAYQDAHAFWKIGGEDVNIFGLGQGTIDGSGQMWWNAKAENFFTIRPVLMLTDGLKGGSISGINMRDTPMWFNLVANSSDVLITDMNLSDLQTNPKAPPANTDGWDTYRSDNIIIQNSYINNDDDCVSFKPNSTNILIQNLHCHGSNGVSVGSLGQYRGEIDIVENLYIYNITMEKCTRGARLKIWPGKPVDAPPSVGGGGEGYVRNVTWEKVHNIDNDWAIELSQCYAKNATECAKYPSNMTITDIYYKDFTGTTNAKEDPWVGTLVCSHPSVCNHIYATNITITPRSGVKDQWECKNLDTSLLDVNCVPR